MAEEKAENLVTEKKKKREKKERKTSRIDITMISQPELNPSSPYISSLFGYLGDGRGRYAPLKYPTKSHFVTCMGLVQNVRLACPSDFWCFIRYMKSTIISDPAIRNPSKLPVTGRDGHLGRWEDCPKYRSRVTQSSQGVPDGVLQNRAKIKRPMENRMGLATNRAGIFHQV